jgi:ferredoxin
MSKLNQHYVCTRDEARAILATHDRFWVSNCGCREGRGGCDRSRMDVCLSFSASNASGGDGLCEIDRGELEGLLQLAGDAHLVARPFRDDSRLETVGFCFCCDDCCGYFLHPHEEPCDKGNEIEITDLDACSACGECTQVCYFGARTVKDGQLDVDREACYGCGLCLDVCPEECIRLEPRGGA